MATKYLSLAASQYVAWDAVMTHHHTLRKVFSNTKSWVEFSNVEIYTLNIEYI